MILIQRLFLALSFFTLISCGGSKSVVQEKKESGKEIPDEKTRLLFEQAYLNGEREKALGNTVEAIDYYENALSIYPKSAAANYTIADLYFSAGKYTIAYQYINQAIELDGANIYYYNLKAEICHTLTRHIESAEAREKMMQMAPGNVDTYFDAANEYIYAKNYKAALAVYDKMEARFGVGEDLVRQKQQLYLMLGKPEKAVEELKKLIQVAPSETRYQGMLAELYWTMGKKNEAVALYKEILNKEPGNGYAHFGMAEYYRSENNKTLMLSSLNSAFKDARIEAQPKLSVIYSLLPAIDTDPSIKKPIFQLAETIRTTHPQDAAAHATLGDLYLADSRDEEAAEEYRAAVNIDPSNLEVWKNLCSILIDMGDFRGLLLESNKALELFPEQAILYYYNATANSQLKTYQEVVTSAKLGLGLYSPDSEINLQLYILLGDAHHNLNDHAASDKAFDKALEIDPENSYVLNNYAYYLSIRKEELEKAKRMSAKTLDIEPRSSSYLDTYGWILYQMEDYKGALTYISKSLEIEAESPEVLEHMGDVLYKLKRADEAMKYWKRALELKPESSELPKKINGTFIF